MQLNAIALLTTTLLAGAQASAIPASAPAVVPQDAVPVFEGSGAELAGLKAKRDGKYEWAVVLGLYSDYSCGAGQRDNTKPDGTCYPMGDNDKGMKIFWLAQGCRGMAFFSFFFSSFFVSPSSLKEQGTMQRGSNLM